MGKERTYKREEVDERERKTAAKKDKKRGKKKKRKNDHQCIAFQKLLGKFDGFVLFLS